MPWLGFFFGLFLAPLAAQAQYIVFLQEPIGGTSVLIGMNGFQLVTQYIHAIYVYLASIIGLVAVLYIVFAGLEIIFGGAVDTVGNAKTRILQSILSLMLLFGSALLLKTINAEFFGGGGGGGLAGIFSSLLGAFGF